MPDDRCQEPGVQSFPAPSGRSFSGVQSFSRASACSAGIGFACSTSSSTALRIAMSWRSPSSRPSERDEGLRQDIAMRKAVELLVEHAKPIPAEQAEAREKLWTPEKERPEGAGKLCTPGS